MAKVNGVCGEIDTAELGFTLMHEHVLVMNWAMRQAFPEWFDRNSVVARAVAMLSAARDRGVRTLVDVTPINLGRDIHLIREVSEQSGMQIIVATGFYWTEEPWFLGWDVDRLVELLMADVRDGIQGTSCCAGLIKVATGEAGLTEVNRKLLRVAARLHRATGIPITTHSDMQTRNGLLQQDLFDEEDVDLSRVIIGHCGEGEDFDLLEAILKRGSYIGMDRFGLDVRLSMSRRVDLVAELCRRGYADKMVLSHDASCHIDWFPDDVRQWAPRWDFRHIPDEVLPALRMEGISDEEIETMTVGNPRRIFKAQDGY